MNTENSKRIFIVDDDPFWTALLTQMLKDLGYTQIFTFENGRECLRHLHLNPNLVFLDYLMEDMDGIDVLQSIKEYFPGICVVFCTSHEDLSVAVNAMKYGSFEYLLKSNATRKEMGVILGDIKQKQVLADKIY